MNNKKLSLLLCLVVVIVCLLGAAACEVNAHEHAYVERKAVAATCTEDGNQLYYTCEGCDKIFDADKKDGMFFEQIPQDGEVSADLRKWSAATLKKIATVRPERNEFLYFYSDTRKCCL